MLAFLICRTMGIGMYAQVTVTAAYDQEILRQALRAQMGATEVAAVTALMRTRFAKAAEEMAETVVAAQALRDAAVILYFFDGPDTITIYITARAMAELKTQTRRVIRQLLPLLKRGKKVVTVNILAEGELGIDSLILNGSRVSLLRQLISVAGDKWISKLLCRQ
jgi:hypothetical protein